MTSEANVSAQAEPQEKAGAEPLIKVQGLRKSFGSHLVLRDIDL